jgi:integrase
MGRSKTAGITVDAAGNRIISKTVEGIQIFARLGAVTQEQAEAELARRVRETQERIERGRRTRRTFGQACVHYLSLDEIKAKRSVDTDAYHIALLEPFLGELELSAIHDDAPKLKEFKKHRLATVTKAGQKVSPTTVKRSLEVLRRILRLASMKWRNEDGTPWLATAPLLEMPENPHARKPFPLSWEEQRLLFSWLPKHLAEMALFKVNTGTREAEVCGLRWKWEQQIPELRTSVFIVPAGMVKNNEDRLIVLNDTARAVVEARRGKHPTHVFTFEGAPVAKMNNTAWQRARREAAAVYEEELQDDCPPLFAKVRVHDLKHTCGRRLRSAGVSLETRKVLLGHKNGDITTHYSVPEIAELLSAVQKICTAKGTPAITLLRVAA